MIGEPQTERFLPFGVKHENEAHCVGRLEAPDQQGVYQADFALGIHVWHTCAMVTATLASSLRG
jgi:hypothetical protein